jgi:hypothetical protein
MFGMFNPFTVERRLNQLANTVAQYREAVELLKEKIVAERDEVRQGIADEVAQAIAPLQEEIDTLREKVEELVTRPEGTIDISEVLADFATLKEHVGEIYVAPTVEEPTPEIELPIDEEDEEEFDDSPTAILDPSAPPEADVIVTEPEVSEPGTDTEGEYTFPDPT